jgi:hypothetical protein
LRHELNIIDSSNVAWAKCIHSHTLTCVWFRYGHGNRGSAVLIDWTIPPPIMPIVSVLFYLVICHNLSSINESRFWAQDISSRCHAYMLIHGGHWPPTSFVEEFPFGFISLSPLYGNVLVFGLIWFYLHICKHEHFVPHSVNLLHPKPISSTNLLKISMTCPLHYICWSGRGGRRLRWAGDSGLGSFKIHT